MPFNPHQRARFLADEARVAGISQDDALWLRSHTADCAECARYEEAVERIVRGLNSFAFECDPSMGARVQSAAGAYVKKPAPVWRWVLAAAALLVTVAGPAYKLMRDTRRENADALLMEAVESRVWRNVPVAMEPLMQSQLEQSR